MNNEVTININIPDKDIEKLEKVKQLLKDIKEIDNNFMLSNVINVDKDAILIVNLDNVLLKENDIRKYEAMLSDKLEHKCVILGTNMRLDKAIEIDYAKGRDYTTTIYYDGNGNPVKGETIQYK